jgi:plasmid stabilization system protein ParE
MKVVFSDLARTRLHDIQGHIAFHNIRAAEKVVDRILYAAEMLGDHPLLGTVWKDGTFGAHV